MGSERSCTEAEDEAQACSSLPDNNDLKGLVHSSCGPAPP